jgi:hypothetical protein
MASGRLNLHERYRIHALFEAGHPLRTISLSDSFRAQSGRHID